MLTGSAATGSSISGLDLLNLFSSVAAIVLAILALILSIFFFVQGKNAADQASKSADRIASSVARLEALFNSMYSDTFSMMRDTVTDMRQHIWPVKDDTANVIEAERERSQATLIQELARVSRSIGIQDAKINQLRDELAPIFNEALKEQEEVSSKVYEVEWEELENRILVLLSAAPMRPADLRSVIGVTSSAIARAISRLIDDGSVAWGGPKEVKGAAAQWTQPLLLTEHGKTRSLAYLNQIRSS